MSHVREQIVGAVVTLLTGLTTTGSNVFPDRDHAVGDSQLPCLLVFDDDEPEQEVRTLGAVYMQERQMILHIDALAKDVSTTSLRSKMNTIQLEVEKAVAGSYTLGGLARGGVNYAGCANERSGNLEKHTAKRRISYVVGYRVMNNAPDVAI